MVFERWSRVIVEGHGGSVFDGGGLWVERWLVMEVEELGAKMGLRNGFASERSSLGGVFVG